MTGGFARRQGMAEFDYRPDLKGGADLWHWRRGRDRAVLFGEEQRYSAGVAEKLTLKLR